MQAGRQTHQLLRTIFMNSADFKMQYLDQVKSRNPNYFPYQGVRKIIRNPNYFLYQAVREIIRNPNYLRYQGTVFEH